MSDAKQLVLTGASKGGGDQRAPVDHAATLFSRATAQIVDLLCEGEIEGLLDSVDPGKSIYFDEVLVQNADGTFNFEGVTIQTRVGTPSQTAVQGFDAVESSVSVSQEVTDVSSPQFTITEESIDALRIIIQLPSLMIQNTENGDLLPHTVGISIEVSENDSGGVFTEIVNNEITGKTKSAYQRAYRIDLSSYTVAANDYPLIFKISRTTPEATETTTQDQIFVDSYVEIQEQKFEYPDSAYVAITVDSELFGGKIPKRSYEIQGLKIQHPSNYDPETRVYTGIWDGTFSEGYCNNPAWVMYDMLTNSRYGLGDDIDASQVDKAALYQIGIYCDELVDDGKGGQEPRFTLNAVITQRKEAYTVLNAIASVFRGMAFWSAGGVSFSNDQPKDPVRIVTNANVKDGDFTYSGVGLKARHSAVLVTWNDPLDFYRQQIEVVEDPDLIQRFGWRQLELVAFGTTSRAQAIRMGKWILQAESTETETVTYEAGWDHADTTPGQIIQISDEHRVGSRIAGRVLATDLHSLTPAIATDAFAIESTFTSVTTYVDTGVESDADATFKCTLKIPSAIAPEGLVFEAGDDTSSGAYVGFDSSGNLIFRAGDGSASPDVATSARIAIPYASLLKDQDLDILWDYRISPGRIRVWINNQFVAEQGTSAGADFLGSVWANTNGAGYGTLGGAATVLGEAGSYTQDVQDSGVVLVSTLQYWRNTDIYTPLQSAVLKESFSDGDTITSVTDTTSGGMDRNTNAVISCGIKTPAAGTVPVGIIAELGEGTLTSDEAFYLGFDGTGDLVVHAGAGGATPDTAEAARIVVPASEWTADTWYNLTVQLLPATGEITLHINHIYYEAAQTSDLGPFQNSQWADATSGGYGKAGTTLSTSDLTGAFASAFNGTLVSSLDYYRDETLDDPNAITAGTVTLDQDWTAEPGDSLVVVVADNAPDIIKLSPGTSGADVSLIGRPRKDIPLNAVFFIQGAVSAQEWTVLNNREADTHQYQITALRYDKTKFARVEEGIIIEPERVSLVPTGTLLPPTNLNFDESLYVTNGVVHTRVNLSWTPSTDPRTRLYRVEYEAPGTNRQLLGVTGIPNITIQPAEEGIHSFWVTSISNGTGASHIVSTAELLNQTVLGKSAPPGDVENFTADRGYAAVTLTWDAVADLDFPKYEIRTGSDWDNGTPIVELLQGTSFSVVADTTEDVTYSIKAIDSTGNYSLNATSLTTSIQVIPAVTSLNTYQRLHNIRITWAAITTVANIQYEIRHSKTSETWETSRLFERVSTPYVEVPFSVTAATTETIRVKPFVELASGNPFYGPETTVDHTQQPVINGYRVKSRTLETAWAELGADLPARFVAHGPAVDDTYVEGATIRSVTNWFEGYSGNKRIDAIDDGAWRVTINVSGGTPTGNILGVGAETTWGAMSLGFDGEGDLIWRVGNGRAQWFQQDVTSLNQRWGLLETSGTRASKNVTAGEPVAGTNDLTETGTVGEGIGAGSGSFNLVPTSLFESTTPSYLSGTDISIAGNDWTLMFNFAVNSSSDGTGKLFQLGSGNTLSVELIDGDTLRATVYDSGGAVSVDSLPRTLTDDTWYFGFVLFEHSTLTLTVGIGRAYDDTGTVASGGLVDGSGSLIVGKDFDGSMCQVEWYDRLWDISTSMELELWESRSINSLNGYTRVVVPNASIPTGQDVELLFDIAKGDFTAVSGDSPAHARLWVDDTLYEADSDDGFGILRLRATSSGKFAAAKTTNKGESAGYYDALSNVTIESDLDYWNKQLVYDTLEISADELTMVSGAEYAEYVFDFDFAGNRKGRMWVEYSAVSVATGELDIADALMEINDADFPITESFSAVDPQVAVLIQLDGSGDYVPFEEGTYEFTTSKIKITLTAGANGITKPSIENFSVYFHNDGDRISLQNQTTDATQTDLTTDGTAATVLNTVVLTDDNTLRFEGTLMARKSDNTETARYFIEGTLTRGTGAASVVMETSQLTVLHEDDENWDVALSADTTLGGLAVKVTGVAATTIDWIADIFVREFG